MARRPKDLVGLGEAAEALGKSRKTLQRWRKRGAPFSDEGTVDVEELRAWALANGVPDVSGVPSDVPVPTDPAPPAEGTPIAEPTEPAKTDGPTPEELEAGRALRERLQAAEKPEDFFAVLREIAMGALPGGGLSTRTAKLLLDVNKQAMASHRGGRTVDVLAGAIDILTPQERKLVDDYRRSRAIAPLQPGETPPPPPAEEPPAPPPSSDDGAPRP